MITKKQTTEIKMKLLKQNKTQSALAIEWEVSLSLLNAVINGKGQHLRLEERLLQWLQKKGG